MDREVRSLPFDQDEKRWEGLSFIVFGSIKTEDRLGAAGLLPIWSGSIYSETVFAVSFRGVKGFVGLFV